MSARGLDSRMDEAWRLIMDESIGTVAICGQGGIGKTHFMRQLYSKLVSTKHFDYVVWVTVSSNLALENILSEIAKNFGVFDENWQVISYDEKVQLIHDELSKWKFVLLLDDIWKPVNLTGLGVPNLQQQNQIRSNSKVIFTTRSKDVCEEMFADHTFKLEMLCVEEAWELFRAQVRNDEILSHPKIQRLAREMVRRCMGWPILLCAIGRVMSCRDELYEWNDALEDLKNRSMKDACDASGDGNGTLNLGYNALDTIIGAGLLEEEGVGSCVKLLDMVHECVLSVAIKSQRFGNARLIEATDLDQLETVGRIALMRHSITNIADFPKNLFNFFLYHDPFVIVKGEISQFMDALTVLDLSNCGVVEIPKEFSSLISLQYLNLSRTWIEYLPIELKMLTKLKCLNLEYSDQLRVIPKQLIYSLSSLQVLKMFRCGFSVEEEEGNIMSIREMDLDPLLCLKDLKALSITITCYSALLQFFSSSKLSSCTQSLSLEVFWGSKSLDISPLAAMKSLLTLEIHKARDLEFTGYLQLSTLPRERIFERLEQIKLENCGSFQELTWVSLVPSLKVLSVRRCEQMHSIISIDRLHEAAIGEEHLEPFAKLEVLMLESLPRLRSIYWKALPFQCLKKIEVWDCFLLAKLPLNSDSAKANDLVIEGEEEWWNGIIWENDATKATFQSCFTNIILFN